MNKPLYESSQSNYLDLLLSNSREVNFQKGEIIIKSGAPYTDVIYLKSGLVKIIHENSNGKTNIIQISSEGQFIELICLLSNSANTYTSIALNSVTVCYIIASDFTENLRKNTEIYEHLIKDTMIIHKKNINRLITINNKQLPGRVADVILYFYNLFNQAMSFDFPLSREELAQFSGTTKESFIRTLTEFKNDKIVILEGKHVIINSLDIIKTLSRLG